MNKTAAHGLALCVCALALGAFSVLPTLHNDTSGYVQPDVDELSLAVLAEVPTSSTQEEPTPQIAPTDNVVITSNVLIDDELEVAVLLPTQEISSAPAMAPEMILVALPTVTPTPQRVIAADQNESPSVVTLNTSLDGCSVASPPASLGLDPFYTKYCSAFGIPIVSSSAVPDAALQRTWEIVMQMLSSVPQTEELRNTIVGMSTRIGIIGADQVTTDMPEHRSLYTQFPGVDWNTRARGVAATREIPLLSIAEENLLCYPSDLWIGQNVLVHEFAHTIKNMGLDLVNPTFDAELQRTYQHALDTGLWPKTYVISDADEYWAEGVRLYFQSDGAGVPEGQSYPASSRAELQSYDPELYRMVENIFGPHGGISSCPNQ